jgi:hypothetical protein
MKLYHYSNESITEIDPLKFGSSHTPYSICKRSYFYVNPDYKEKFFLGARFRYIVDIDESKVFHTNFGISGEYLLELKKKGFIGVSYFLPNGEKIIALFHSQKVIKKEVL